MPVARRCTPAFPEAPPRLADGGRGSRPRGLAGPARPMAMAPAAGSLARFRGRLDNPGVSGFNKAARMHLLPRRTPPPQEQTDKHDPGPLRGRCPSGLESGVRGATAPSRFAVRAWRGGGLESPMTRIHRRQSTPRWHLAPPGGDVAVWRGHDRDPSPARAGGGGGDRSCPSGAGRSSRRGPTACQPTDDLMVHLPVPLRVGAGPAGREGQ